jgi:hypothetical protein
MWSKELIWIIKAKFTKVISQCETISSEFDGTRWNPTRSDPDFIGFRRIPMKSGPDSDRKESDKNRVGSDRNIQIRSPLFDLGNCFSLISWKDELNVFGKQACSFPFLRTKFLWLLWNWSSNLDKVYQVFVSFVRLLYLINMYLILIVQAFPEPTIAKTFSVLARRPFPCCAPWSNDSNLIPWRI